MHKCMSKYIHDQNGTLVAVCIRVYRSATENVIIRITEEIISMIETRTVAWVALTCTGVLECWSALTSQTTEPCSPC